MNTKDEALSTERALKLAPNALEFNCISSEDGEDLTPSKTKKAVTAIREVLAQSRSDEEQPAQQEPVADSKAPMLADWLQANYEADEIDEAAEELRRLFRENQLLWKEREEPHRQLEFYIRECNRLESERDAALTKQQEPVAIEYWLQDTMESGRWVTTDNMAKATAEKMLSGEYGDVYPQGRIVESSPPNVPAARASKPLTDEQIERFAALIASRVAAAERNSWPAEMEAMERQVNILTDALAQAKAEEREACAAICDRFQARDVGMQPAECAGAIRARGET
jgi:hypothetical protein